MRRRLIRLVLAAALPALAGPAAASPIYSASAIADGAVSNTAPQGPNPVQVSTQGPETHSSASSSLLLKGFASASAPEPNVLTNVRTSAEAHAFAHYDDITIFGPAVTVQGTLHVPFHGVFSDRRQVWSGGETQFQSNVTGNVDLTASFNGARPIPVSISFDAFNGLPVPNPLDSASAAYTTVFSDFVHPLTCGNACPYAGLEGIEAVEFSGTIDFPGLFPVNTPLSLDLTLDVNVTAISFFLASAAGQLDLLNTFGVPQNGQPVFDLPPGFTSNSVSLGIVNNVVPGPEGPSSGVSMPASLALLILGGLVAVVRARLTRPFP